MINDRKVTKMSLLPLASSNRWRVPAAIAQKLEDALPASSDELRQLGREVEEVVHTLFAGSTEDFRRHVLAAPRDGNPIQDAYLIGQLTFAQAFADQLACRRESSAFRRLVADTRFVRYVGALCLEDLNNAELARRVGEVDETVSRKLKALRSEGVVDYRREGRNTVNFLTPAARASFAEHCAASRNALVVDPLVSQLLREKLEEKESHYRGPMTFGSREPAHKSEARLHV